MVHGRERASVRAAIDGATARAGLGGCAREILFSRRRFKQEGPRRFRDLQQEASHA